MKSAIDIIRSEHRALAAVLSGLSAFVDGLSVGKFESDTFAARRDDRIRHRSPGEGSPSQGRRLPVPGVAQAKRRPPPRSSTNCRAEHHTGPAKLGGACRPALDHYRAAGADGLPRFAMRIKKPTVDFQWRRAMSKEETLVLPIAREVLTAQDRAAIDGVFVANDNPWEGPAGGSEQLFTRIVSILAPDPIGVRRSRSFEPTGVRNRSTSRRGVTMNQPSDSLPVLVAGGGIGGLAAALALARQGFAVKVLEQARAARRDRRRHPARSERLCGVRRARASASARAAAPSTPTRW